MEKVFGSNFRANLKEYMEKAEVNPLLIERRASKSLVLMSEDEYNRLMAGVNTDVLLNLDIEKVVNEIFERRMVELEQQIAEKRRLEEEK
jgi:PHD/YefM family antitoxin component YafN of YafNO toxin-antitoxin module